MLQALGMDVDGRDDTSTAPLRGGGRVKPNYKQSSTPNSTAQRSKTPEICIQGPRNFQKGPKSKVNPKVPTSTAPMHNRITTYEIRWQEILGTNAVERIVISLVKRSIRKKTASPDTKRGRSYSLRGGAGGRYCDYFYEGESSEEEHSEHRRKRRRTDDNQGQPDRNVRLTTNEDKDKEVKADDKRGVESPSKQRKHRYARQQFQRLRGWLRRWVKLRGRSRKMTQLEY